MMENSEKVFFEYDDVKVTNTRFIYGSNTFAMAGITSLKIRKQPPDYWGLVILAILIFVCIVVMFSGQLIGGFLGAAILSLIFWGALKTMKTKYFIVLSTSGGEVEALTTQQLEYATRVTAALNEAIIYRN